MEQLKGPNKLGQKMMVKMSESEEYCPMSEFRKANAAGWLLDF